MLTQEAKLYYKCGNLKTPTIVPSLLNIGYSVLLQLKSGEKEYLYRQRGGEAVYNTLDAAYSAIRKIGFNDANIRM